MKRSSTVLVVVCVRVSATEGVWSGTSVVLGLTGGWGARKDGRCGCQHDETLSDTVPKCRSGRMVLEHFVVRTFSVDTVSGGCHFATHEKLRGGWKSGPGATQHVHAWWAACDARAVDKVRTATCLESELKFFKT